MMSRIDNERLKVFFGVLVALAVVFEVVLWMTDADPNSSRMVYMFTPMIAGLAVAYWTEYSPRDFGLRVGNVRWLGASLLIGLLVVGLTVAIAVAVPGVYVAGSALDALPVPPGLPGIMLLVVGTVLFALTLGTVTGFGEEFGWRGYLLWELSPLGFWRASVVIGIVWGLWHGVGILQGLQYESFPYVGVFVFTAATVALSPVYTYVVWRAKSVLAAALLHGVFNSASMTVIGLLTADSEFLSQLVATTIGIAGIIACLLVCGLIYLHGTPSIDRETLDWDSDRSSTSQTVTAD